ncbi:glycosyltransferase [Paraferrimonas sp. SM1919]|uniref:glycosyltransferase n=1 Tax=Paraferrimonas sp. SM1919 TaxID=2662263 RepID=UPI0013D56CA5|nr:glycosyltransferase [Paraferrimonas sp. SM1919]
MPNIINKVSIITLTYNNHNDLIKTIESVANQKLPKDVSIEYIIADDGSLDFDLEYYVAKLKSFPELLGSKVYKNEENLGTVKSFNKAIKISSGELIVPLSCSDVFASDDVLLQIVNYFQQNDELLALGKSLTVNNEEILSEYQEKLILGDTDSILKEIVLRKNFLSGACTYYTRRLLDDYGLFDEGYSLLEDFPFYVNILNDGVKIGYISQPCIKYDDNGVSKSGSLHPKLVSDLKRLRSHILEMNILTKEEREYFLFWKLWSVREKIRHPIIAIKQLVKKYVK